MIEIVTNRCMGGFNLSYAATMLYAEKTALKLFAYYSKYVDGKAQWFKYNGEYPEPEYLMYTLTENVVNEPDFEDRAYKDKLVFLIDDVKRDDRTLVSVIRELGDKANTGHSKLEITQIPDGVDWELCVADQGYEWIAEKHRTW